MSANRHAVDPLRIAVLISGGGSTLANLIDQIHAGALRGVRIETVISSRSAVRGVQIARSAGLPTEVIRRRDYDDPTGFSAAVADVCDAARVDLVVMGGFLCYWDFPSRYAGRIVNIHPSLLPKFGGVGMHGLAVHRAVLAAGETESGCTVHLVDHEYDHGPIIAQRRVPVLPDDTPETLAARVGVEERRLYPEVLQRVADQGTAALLATHRGRGGDGAA